MSQRVPDIIFPLNETKALHALAYVCNSQGGSVDLYHLLKVIFFADSEHLFRYGRPITGDVMHSMRFGPVPSYCYDLVKGGNKYGHMYFSRDEGDIIENLFESDSDIFSLSDLECLDFSIEQNMRLPFGELRDKSHTPAYEKTKHELGLNKPISLLDIAREDGKLDEDMLTYIISSASY